MHRPGSWCAGGRPVVGHIQRGRGRVPGSPPCLQPRQPNPGRGHRDHQDQYRGREQATRPPAIERPQPEPARGLQLLPEQPGDQEPGQHIEDVHPDKATPHLAEAGVVDHHGQDGHRPQPLNISPEPAHCLHRRRPHRTAQLEGDSPPIGSFLASSHSRSTLGSCSGNTSGIGSSSVACSGVGRLVSRSISASRPSSHHGIPSRDLVADLEQVRMMSTSATTSGRGLGPPGDDRSGSAPPLQGALGPDTSPSRCLTNPAALAGTRGHTSINRGC